MLNKTKLPFFPSLSHNEIWEYILSKQIETDIFNYMSKSGSAVGCMKTYLPYWKARGLSQTDVYIISHFLFSSGAYKEIIRFSLECLEKDDPVSWYYLGKVLRLVEPNLKSSIFQRLRDYIEDHRKWDEFSSSDLFDTLFPHETEIKFQQLQRRVQIKERHRQTLLDQIRVFNQSRNYNIEKQSILKFIKFFPNDKLGQEMLDRYQLEDLQRFFQRYQNEKRLEEKINPNVFTNEENELLNQYYENAKNKEPVLLESFIYFFIFLEDYPHALELVHKMNSSASKDWLQLELMILNRKFAAALAYIHDVMDLSYNDHSFYYSAKTYYVAQCLWGLGEHRKAIELMNNLINVHPEYRLASSFLKEWKLEL